MRKGSRVERKDPYEITAVVVRRARLGEITDVTRTASLGGRPDPRMDGRRRQVPIEAMS